MKNIESVSKSLQMFQNRTTPLTYWKNQYFIQKNKNRTIFWKKGNILNIDEKIELLTKYNLSIQPININIKVNLIAKTLNKGKMTMSYESQQIGTFHHDQMMWLSALFLYILF